MKVYELRPLSPICGGLVRYTKNAKDLTIQSLQWDKIAIAYALKGQMLFDEGS